MIVIGIDPGMDGAFAFIDSNGTLQDVVDMPTDRIEVSRAKRGARKAGKTERRRISVQGVLALLDGLDGNSCVAFMERLVAMPSRPDPLSGARRTMGPASMGEFFRGGGIIETALAARGIGLTLVGARTWKVATNCPTGKDAARTRAAQQFPAFAPRFARVKDDGRAEASIIALYGVMLTAGLAARHAQRDWSTLPAAPDWQSDEYA
jgi:crossover junction endodeoxyribonuclease RuvC